MMKGSGRSGKNPADPESLPENTYYADIAYKIKWAKWISAAFLILFISGGALFNSNELNAENFGYLLRYINIQGPGRPGKEEFYIELDETSSVRYYKNNIVSIRKNRLDIYDMNGRKNFTSGLVYSNPVLKTSERYIITYDLGANKMEIFNSFSKIYTYKGDRPIYGAQVTDRGNVAYITSEKGYRSAVYVMDSAFNIIFGCKFGEDFIVGADIDDKARRLAVAGFSAHDGDYLGRVILYDTNSEEPIKKTEITGEQPYRIKLHEEGIFAVFENSFRFYDLNGEEISSYDFAQRKIETADLTSRFAAVALSEATLGTCDLILIFGGNGNILYEYAVDEEIKDIKFSENFEFMYFLTRTGLYKINTVKTGPPLLVSTDYDETADSIVYANEKKIFLSGLVKINAVDAGEN